MTTAQRPFPPSDWIHWLNMNIRRGCDRQVLATTMLEQGFDPQAVQLCIDTSVNAMPEVPGLGYLAEPNRLGDGTREHLGRTKVRLVASMSDPNITVIDNVLSARECAELIEIGREDLKRLTVVVGEGMEGEVHAGRTSEGSQFALRAHPLIERLEERIAKITGIPLENGEGLQVMRYGPGNEYQPHHDYFDKTTEAGRPHLKAGGERVATMVIYLNSVEQGGDTSFPEMRFSVKPHPGRAVYFEYTNQAEQLDARCLHAGNPVLAGEKWIATKWLRQGRWA